MSLLDAFQLGDLKRYFECRRDFPTTGDPQAEDIFRAGDQRFSTHRFDNLYRRWIKHGDEVFAGLASAAITNALESGAGRVESFVLPHSYRHLCPLVGQWRSTDEDVEKGVEKRAARGGAGPRRSQPRVSTPWASRERSMVM